MKERIPAIQKLIRQLMTEHRLGVDECGEPCSDDDALVYQELVLIDDRLTLIRSYLARMEKENV